jgi:hypothetical protein
VVTPNREAAVFRFVSDPSRAIEGELEMDFVDGGDEGETLVACTHRLVAQAAVLQIGESRPKTRLGACEV